MPDTIFDKIVSKEIPSFKVYEDENVYAFLDIQPLSKGHTVVVLKNGNPSVLDYKASDLADLMVGVQNVMQVLKEKVTPDTFNIGINDGPAAGQTIPYLHVHVIPRWEDDGGGSLHSVVNNPGDVSVEEISKLFV